MARIEMERELLPMFCGMDSCAKDVNVTFGGWQVILNINVSERFVP